MSFDFGDVGSFFGGIGDSINNLFGGGSTDNSTPAAPTPAPDGSTPAAPADTSGGGSSFGNFFSSMPSTGTSTGSISPATGAGTSPSPAVTSNISQFLSPTTSTSAAIAPDTGMGNTDSVLSTSGQTPTPATTDPSTISQITSALGLDKASTGDILKGALGLGGLGYAVSQNSSATPAQKSIEQLAGQQNQQGQQLESYLANGTLPPGAQQYVNQQIAAQTAAIQSKYAALGMSGSTAETQELNNVQQQATTQMFQIASDLYNTGVTETGASGNLYNMLMQAQSANNAQIGSAISNFVSALGGGTTLKVA